MRIITTIAFALGAAGALALGAAYAQDAAKPAPKPEAKKEQRHGMQEHRNGMHRMREMRGGCHGESAAGAQGEEHRH